MIKCVLDKEVLGKRSIARRVIYALSDSSFSPLNKLVLEDPKQRAKVSAYINY